MCGSADEEGASCAVTSPVSEILATTRRNTEYVHAASVRLHQAISNTLICQCHTVHLCLDGQTAKSPAVAQDPKGKSKQQQKPDDQVLAQFSFLFMHGSGESMKPSSTMVCFRPDGSGGIVATTPVGGNGSGTICAEVAAECDGYERYVHDPTGSGGGAGGFRLWLEPSLQSKLGLGGSTSGGKTSGGSTSGGSTSGHSITGVSNSGSYISLQQVINTCHRELTIHDRLIMAISFARSLLHLYSSSWIRDWGIGTIHFFTPQEVQKVEFGQLTPYLALRQGDNKICDRNRDVHNLGYLLLQLGCLYVGELREAAGAAGGGFEIQKAMKKACEAMGRNYVGFVKSCLNDWGRNRELDLMRENQLEAYLEWLVVLREDAKCFTWEDEPE
ncbi:hypothetical protein DFP73DRAFT_562511 [Morchella snyderi]|nr:hypothetical protein DFP73DRAFT_562511 [Morchella snyderi]